MSFKPGDKVKFIGLETQHLGKKLVINPATGILILCDSNTTQPGVMRIEGDLQGMMFLPDGTIYCHSHFGTMLEPVEDPLAEELTAEQLLEKGICPCGSDNGLGCSVSGCPLYLRGVKP